MLGQKKSGSVNKLKGTGVVDSEEKDWVCARLIEK